MQMKLVVDTPADFKEWLASKPTLVKAYKESKASDAVPKDSTFVKPAEMSKTMAQVIKK
jgi:cytochrome c oxidase subunit 2